MRILESGYGAATRHPLPCLLFLTPLLIGYEVGVGLVGGGRDSAVRNGADTWLHWGLAAFGFPQVYWGPLLVAAFFLLWSWARRHDRPGDLFGICLGMALESLAFAIVLWGVNRSLAPMLGHLGIVLGPSATKEKTLSQVLTYVGAGIYEEVLFRLLLFTVLLWVLRQALVGPLPAFAVAALGSALAFAAAHHVGPHGEPFNRYVFFFRSLAGVYFTLLYSLRGFGVTVGTHACYDVLVGAVLG
jgi:hypothetical protein